MNRLLILLAALAVCTGVRAQSVVHGTVFNDTNLNQIFDKGEKGVKGVGVSNGIDVALTDSWGCYELPARDPMIVFVIKPAGYRLPVNDAKLPQFYYIHKPSGSPTTKYPGSAPTGPLSETVDFPLVKYKEPDKFNVIVFGDTQTIREEHIDFLRRGVVSPLVGVKDVAFGTTLGDITSDRLEFFEPVTRAVGRIGVPWYHVTGNHDINYDATDDALASESFEAFFGPTTYSFNHGKVHFVVADDWVYRNDGKGGRYQIGGFREDQLAFIENDLALVPSDRLVVLLVHVDLFDGTDRHFRRADRDRLFEAMSRFPNTLSMSAHTHYLKQVFFGAGDGWSGEKTHHHLNVGAVCGDWWKGIVDQNLLPGAMMADGSPQGYFMLGFDGNSYIYDYKTVHYDEPKQISLSVKEGQLYANFFAGNELSTLRCRVNGGGGIRMERSVEPDPNFVAIGLRWDAVQGLPGDRPSAPVDSPHLWKAPVALAGPDSVVEVEATDIFGRTFAAHMVVE